MRDDDKNCTINDKESRPRNGLKRFDTTDRFPPFQAASGGSNALYCTHPVPHLLPQHLKGGDEALTSRRSQHVRRHSASSSVSTRLRFACDEPVQLDDAVPIQVYSLSADDREAVDEDDVEEGATKRLHVADDMEPPSSGDAHVDMQKKAVTEWRSIYWSSAVTFLSSIQFGLYFSSMWPFLKQLDPSATESFFGVVIASYSAAQVIASPLLGYWSNRIRSLRIPLLVCALLMWIGNCAYFFVETLPVNHRFTLLFARFVTGAGASNLGLLKAFASAASVSADRARAIAFITGGFALGITFGPAFQMIFSGIGYPGWRIGDRFSINIFNGPALLACGMNVSTMFILLFCFRESFVGVLDAKKMKKRKTPKDKEKRMAAQRGGPSAEIQLPDYDRVAAAACYALRFTQMFIITNLETVGTSYEMMTFAWNAREAVFYSAVSHSLRGSLAFFVYLGYIVLNLGSVANERLICLIAVIGLLSFHIITYPWPFLSNHVKTFNNTMLWNDTEQAVGCNVDFYAWCDSLTAVNFYVYYFFLITVIGLSFPNMNVTMNTLFSRIIGPRMQGTQQGILQMCGGTARMAGPLIVGLLYTSYGPRSVWILEIVVISAMILGWCVVYKRLVPLRVPPELLRPNNDDAQMSADAEENTRKRPDENGKTGDFRAISCHRIFSNFNDKPNKIL